MSTEAPPGHPPRIGRAPRHQRRSADLRSAHALPASHGAASAKASSIAIPTAGRSAAGMRSCASSCCAFHPPGPTSGRVGRAGDVGRAKALPRDGGSVRPRQSAGLFASPNPRCSRPRTEAAHQGDTGAPHRPLEALVPPERFSPRSNRITRGPLGGRVPHELAAACSNQKSVASCWKTSSPDARRIST